jgi:AcrR family transcriptional regulator
MSDICREAGVSRGTVYRYFTSKDDVIEAVNQRIKTAGREFLERAVAANPDPAQRVRVVLRALMRVPREFPHMARIVEREPATALDFLTREMPRLAQVAAEFLEPALRDSPPVRSGAVTVVELAEIFQRLVSSTILLPTRGSSTLDARIADLWEAMAAAPANLPAPAKGAVARTRKRPAARAAAV